MRFCYKLIIVFWALSVGYLELITRLGARDCPGCHMPGLFDGLLVFSAPTIVFAVPVLLLAWLFAGFLRVPR